MALRHARDWGSTDPRWFWTLDREMRAWVVAEWNLRQQSAEEEARLAAQRRRRPGHAALPPSPPPPPPRRPGRPQSPRTATALLAHVGTEVKPDAAAFWFGGGHVHVSG